MGTGGFEAGGLNIHVLEELDFSSLLHIRRNLCAVKDRGAGRVLEVRRVLYASAHVFLWRLALGIS